MSENEVETGSETTSAEETAAKKTKATKADSGAPAKTAK